jgi:choline oxidase
MEYDYVVVGGGTSGAIVAARLAERSDCTVCLLEAGPPDEGDPRILRYRDWESLLRSEFDYDYSIQPQAVGNSRIHHARARVLGGCSSHNSVIAIRPFDTDLKAWEQRGAVGWGPADVAPHFDKVLSRVTLTKPGPVNESTTAFVKAGRELGFPLSAMDGGPRRQGVGWLHLNVEGDIRQSSSVAYLHPLDRLPDNFTIRTGTRALRIVVDDSGRARSVVTEGNEIRAREEIVVACGPFESPRLLMLSGIGPSDELRRFGIPVRVELPAVGEHLLDHPQGYVVWELSRPMPPAPGTGFEAAVFGSVTPNSDDPDVMIVFGTGWAYVDTDAAQYVIEPPAHSMVMIPTVCRARSEGVVRLSSRDPSAKLIVDPRYFSDPDGYDEAMLVGALELARRLGRQDSLSGWIKRELAPGEGVSGPELREYATKVSNTNDHPAGTCRMGGENDQDAVVDPLLRVQGVQGLRVADTSIFPVMPSVNICLTAMMIGEKCADLMTDGAGPAKVSGGVPDTATIGLESGPES